MLLLSLPLPHLLQLLRRVAPLPVATAQATSHTTTSSTAARPAGSTRGGVSEPEPAARRFHRGTRAGGRVKARRNRAAERASPFTAASAGTSPFSAGGHGAGIGLFGSTPGPTPFRDACCHRAAPAQVGRSVLADRTVQPHTARCRRHRFSCSQSLRPCLLGCRLGAVGQTTEGRLGLTGPPASLAQTSVTLGHLQLIDRGASLRLGRRSHLSTTHLFV